MAALNGEIDDLAWKTDLALSLSKQADLPKLRDLCKGRRVPVESRPELWKTCLNVVGKPDALVTWDGLMDMSEQDVLKEDCLSQSAKLNLKEDDEEEVARDMEGLITFYCKSRGEKYRTSSGLVELLSPFITLNLPLSQVYNCFYAMQSKFIPRECYRDGKPFHLFRQLLQYHDPQLCSFLDSRKISPDSYGQRWLRSLFVSVCDSDVVHAMWDYYYLESDPYFVFFLMLVMVLNAKDQIMELSTQNKSSIIEIITNFPSQLGADDIEDFCQLAHYYAIRTPNSYRKDFQPFLFGSKITINDYISNSLCLQVSLAELLEAAEGRSNEDIRFFLVDCRPAEHYNNGHMPTAFHLDANLMLQEPEEFQTAVVALFATQQQAIEASSNASGEHLCFMGSGRESEDQYVNMVVANFLQRGTHFVSIAKGGYKAVHDLLSDDLDNLSDHNPKSCIVCSPDAFSSEDESSHELSRSDASPQPPTSPKSGGLGEKISFLRNKGSDMKQRFGKFITEAKATQERHVNENDKTGKRYRGVNLDIFSIDDPDDVVTSSGDEQGEAVNIDTWIKRSDVVRHFPCSEIGVSGQMYSSYLLLTSTQLFILREIVDKERPGWANIQSRPHLTSIVKITSKKKHPDLITFKYGTSDGDEFKITGSQRFLIPNSKQVMKKIKERILKLID